MLTTPPIAPKTLAQLHTLGICSLADLQQSGAVRTFLLLKASGLTLTRSTLWQLEALARGIAVQDLSNDARQALLAELAAHPPADVFPPPAECASMMQHALAQAKLAAQTGEIPVGAVVVQQGRIIAAAHNTCVSSHNISHHAEIRALAQAGEALGNYRLDGCDVYITLEPCPMCASALIQARVRRVIFGAAEPKTGAAGSVINLFTNTALNKHTAVFGGVLAEECKAVLQDFFAARRG